MNGSTVVDQLKFIQHYGLFEYVNFNRCRTCVQCTIDYRHITFSRIFKIQILIKVVRNLMRYSKLNHYGRSGGMDQ